MKFELDLLETIAYNVSNKEEKFSNIMELTIMKNKRLFPNMCLMI